jgi:hypothetical protein
MTPSRLRMIEDMKLRRIGAFTSSSCASLLTAIGAHRTSSAKMRFALSHCMRERGVACWTQGQPLLHPISLPQYPRSRLGAVKSAPRELD